MWDNKVVVFGLWLKTVFREQTKKKNQNGKDYIGEIRHIIWKINVLTNRYLIQFNTFYLDLFVEEGLLCCFAQVKSFMLQRSCSCLLFFPSKKEIMLRPSWSRLPLLKHHETDVSPTENLKVRMILRPPTAGIICSTFAMTNSPWIDVRFHCNF